MRCPECGHSLVGVPERAPCSECGTASDAAQREPGPLPSPRQLFWGFGWPSIAGAVVIALSPLALHTVIDGATVFGLISGAVLLLIVGPVNTVRRTAILMDRLPRRARTAPLLALIPRNVLVPLLAGLATVPVNVAVGGGSCVVFFVLADARS